MTFRAYIRRGSSLYRRWRNEGRIGGVISDVPFVWDGKDYLSDDPLTADQVAAIKDNNMVQLELTAVPPPASPPHPSAHPEPHPTVAAQNARAAAERNLKK